MANVAGSLMGATCVTALDIGLDEHTDHIYRRLREKVIAYDQGRGVLIPGGHGLTQGLRARISQETGIVADRPQVDTLMVLDAVRKVYLPELDIDDVAASWWRPRSPSSWARTRMRISQEERDPHLLPHRGRLRRLLKTWLEQTIAP